ncbi:MAG: hypothetical protein QW727_02185 [Candidatus Pacearchaeota archaeon]
MNLEQITKGDKRKFLRELPNKKGRDTHYKKYLLGAREELDRKGFETAIIDLNCNRGYDKDCYLLIFKSKGRRVNARM